MSLTVIAGMVAAVLLAGTIVAASGSALRAARDASSHPAALERNKKRQMTRRRKRAGLPVVDEPAQVSRLRRRATLMAWWAAGWRLAVVAGIVAGGYLFRVNVWLGAVTAFGLALAYWVLAWYSRRARFRRTHEGAAILQVFLADVDRELRGAELVQMTGQPSEPVFERLAQLEGSGWVKPLWETAEPLTTASDPARRRYLLSDGAAAAARRDLVAAGINPHSQVRPARP